MLKGGGNQKHVGCFHPHLTGRIHRFQLGEFDPAGEDGDALMYVYSYVRCKCVHYFYKNSILEGDESHFGQSFLDISPCSVGLYTVGTRFVLCTYFKTFALVLQRFGAYC